MNDPLADILTDPVKKVPVTIERPKGNVVVTHKFLLLVDVYPNGNVFTKTIPIGRGNKATKKNTTKPATKVKIASKVEEESVL